MAGAARRRVVASTRTTAEEMAARWCVVTSEGRSENVPVMRNYLLSIAAANHDYAQRHSYLFRYAQLSENRCPHPRLGRRVAAWCKILVVADVLLNGIDGQRCHSILYLDSDAVLSNASLSIDGWLERARERRDEALLLDNDWRVLLSSNYWFDPDEANTGVFLLRASGQAGREACGILRRWWDGRWSTFHMNRPWEQVPMAKMLSFVHPSAPDASAATVADGALSGAKTPWGTRRALECVSCRRRAFTGEGTLSGNLGFIPDPGRPSLPGRRTVRTTSSIMGFAASQRSRNNSLPTGHAPNLPKGAKERRSSWAALK